MQTDNKTMATETLEKENLLLRQSHKLLIELIGTLGNVIYSSNEPKKDYWIAAISEAITNAKNIIK